MTLEGRDLLKVKPAQRDWGSSSRAMRCFRTCPRERTLPSASRCARAAAERETRVKQTLNLVGLPRSRALPAQDVRWEQQRVALARRARHQAPHLLLDEPLSNLDAKLREEMQIDCADSAHDWHHNDSRDARPSEAMSLSDRIVVRSRSRRADRASHEAYERPATPFVASFLGKTNVLRADVLRQGDTTFAVIGDGRWPVAHSAAQRARVTVRPEKIGFGDSAACSMGGRIKMRVFQGNHWLYQVETPSGLITVTRPNSGEEPPEEGATVRVTWRAEDMAVQPEP